MNDDLLIKNRIRQVEENSTISSNSTYGAKTRELDREKNIIFYMLGCKDKFYSSDTQLYIIIELIRERVPDFTLSKTRYIDYIKSRPELFMDYEAWVKRSRKEATKVRYKRKLVLYEDTREMKVDHVRDRKKEVKYLLETSIKAYKKLLGE